jgi:hypothetical protein
MLLLPITRWAKICPKISTWLPSRTLPWGALMVAQMPPPLSRSMSLARVMESPPRSMKVPPRNWPESVP